MKKTIAMLLVILMAVTSVFAQGAGEATSEALKLGMVTDAGTIDDRSFNQGTYEGVKQAADELGLECTPEPPRPTTSPRFPTSMTRATGSSHARATSSSRLSPRPRRCILT